MVTVEGNIEALSQAILSEARAEIDELKRNAQSQADSVRKRAQESATKERTAIVEQAIQEARRLRSQATATAQLKARALELEHRERLLDSVFQAVAERLPKVPQREDYGAIVIHLAREALSQLRSDVGELLLDEAARGVFTQDILDDLAKTALVQLTVGGPPAAGFGVIARTPDGHLQFDNTLETRLRRMQSSIRSVVYRVLMGEVE